jgi:hypothetical protein
MSGSNFPHNPVDLTLVFTSESGVVGGAGITKVGHILTVDETIESNPYEGHITYYMDALIDLFTGGLDRGSNVILKIAMMDIKTQKITACVNADAKRCKI